LDGCSREGRARCRLEGLLGKLVLVGLIVAVGLLVLVLKLRRSRGEHLPTPRRCQQIACTKLLGGAVYLCLQQIGSLFQFQVSCLTFRRKVSESALLAIDKLLKFTNFLSDVGAKVLSRLLQCGVDILDSRRPTLDFCSKSSFQVS